MSEKGTMMILMETTEVKSSTHRSSPHLGSSVINHLGWCLTQSLIPPLVPTFLGMSVRVRVGINTVRLTILRYVHVGR